MDATVNDTEEQGSNGILLKTCPLMIHSEIGRQRRFLIRLASAYLQCFFSILLFSFHKERREIGSDDFISPELLKIYGPLSQRSGQDLKAKIRPLLN